MSEFIILIIEFILKTLFYGLVIWATGLLFIGAFKINYNFTFLQSIIIYLIINTIATIVGGKLNIKISKKTDENL